MKELINALKPIFPVTYDLEKFVKLKFDSNAELFTMLVKLVIYLVAGLVVGFVLGLIGKILPFLGFLWWVIGIIVEVYVIAGIVLTVLDYLKIFEDKEDKTEE